MAESKTEVKVIENFRYGGEELEEGTVKELPSAAAQSAIEKGYAEEAGGGDVPVIGGEESGSPPEGSGSAPSQLRETDEGFDVSGYRSADYLSADDVEEGDEMTIEGSGWKDDRFDSEYLYLPVSVDGQKFQWRVNKTNAQILADAFGSKTGQWVGETVVVDEIKDYPGVSQRGIVVSAVEDES